MPDINWAEVLPMVITLTGLELVLGIDNVIFISILADKLPAKNRQLARRIGLLIAMFARVGLLFTITWIIGLKSDLFSIFGLGMSGRDLILLAGGVFLVYKTAKEIAEKISNDESVAPVFKHTESFFSIILQIVVVDIVFSFDYDLSGSDLYGFYDVLLRLYCGFCS
jgi:predicted tellurium resistance membrane protein TerC